MYATAFLLLLSALRDSFRGRATLQLELIAVRHQLATMMRTSRRPSLRPTDRLLWGAPRVHGELMKLGIEISAATASKYMTRLPKPLSQTWRTFFRNHANCQASIDFFVSATATFRLLYVFIVRHHERRRIVHSGVTANPTAAGVAA